MSGEYMNPIKTDTLWSEATSSTAIVQLNTTNRPGFVRTLVICYPGKVHVLTDGRLISLRPILQLVRSRHRFQLPESPSLRTTRCADQSSPGSTYWKKRCNRRQGLSTLACVGISPLMWLKLTVRTLFGSWDAPLQTEQSQPNHRSAPSAIPTVVYRKLSLFQS